MARTSPSGPRFVPSHIHFGHMSLETNTPYVLAGSGAAAVEIADNSPGSPQYQGPTPSTLNLGFSIDASLSPIKRLKWNEEHTLNAMVFYYGTFELSGGGIALMELSLARNGVQESTSKILIELSGNRPNYVMDTTLIQLSQGDALSPMIENVGSGVDVAVYSAHLSVIGGVDL